MRYVSIDLETTGLDPATCDVIEFAAVIDDLDNQAPLDNLPVFHAYIHHGLFQGQAYALSMHTRIFRVLATGKGAEGALCVEPGELGKLFAKFLWHHQYHDKITAAGKNFAGFDLQFLRRLPNFDDDVQFHHRVIDPGLLWWRCGEDRQLPDMATCLKRAGYDKQVSHTAVEDAMDVIRLIRKAAELRVEGGFHVRG